MRRWWQRRTLRFRLALWYGLGGTMLMAGFCSAIYLFVARRMARPLDHALRRDLSEIEAHLSVAPNRSLLWDGSAIRYDQRWRHPWVEIWDEHQHLVARLWPLEDNQLDSLPFAPPPGQDNLSIFNVTSDLRLRALSVPMTVPGAPPGWTMRVLRVHQRLDDPLGTLLLIMVIALPVVVSLLVVGGYAITRRWLSPLDEMVHDAEDITAKDLSQRLSVENPNDELGRLATVFNRTLGRLEDSFTALDRFVADAAHELRTPLTTLRTVGEVGLRSSRSAQDYREIIGSMLEEAQRLQFLVERLLRLATAEGGHQPVRREPVRIDQLVATCIAELAILAETKSQHLSIDAIECEAQTDPVLFRQALQNIVDNAIKYSPEGGEIHVAVHVEEGRLDVSVTDSGPGIPVEHREKVTERFFRSGDARSRRRGGFGLGLAITRAYMQVLGGDLHYEAASPRGSRFTLTLPTT